MTDTTPVMPAQAGIPLLAGIKSWIPAFAGMTNSWVALRTSAPEA